MAVNTDMNPPKPGLDPRDVVRAGYDVIADEFLALVGASRSDAEVRGRVGALIAELRERLPENGDVLDLGCGAGEPYMRMLSQHFNVTGVDFSSRQLELAAQNAPHAC